MISENELNGAIEYFEDIETIEVSENDITEELLNEIRGLREDVQSITDGSIFVCISGNDVTDNEIVHDVSANTVSVNNILNTPINEYGLTDSMLAVFMVTGCIIGLILLMRKVIYKWS